MKIANKYNAEIIEHKEFIGGRYSVLIRNRNVSSSINGFKFK